MNAILVSGYKNHDLGIFQAKDPRIGIIKEAIRRDLMACLEEGLEWLIFTGQLGFETWVLDVAQELQSDYPLQLATIFAFRDQGQNWNEARQATMSRFQALDFVKYAYEAYENPRQFRAYNQFLLDNTSGAYLFYDSEHETNLSYLVNQMKNQDNYHITFLTFDRLNEIAEDLNH